MKKYLIILFLFTTTIFAFGQSNVDFGQLIKSWTQGKIDRNGKVIEIDINRSGWSQLKINTDSTVIFSDPFSCGFGYSRYGKWIVNEADSTVTFSFSKSVGYMNSPGTAITNEIVIYRINKLTTDELILTRIVEGKESMMPFVKTKM